MKITGKKSIFIIFCALIVFLLPSQEVSAAKKIKLNISSVQLYAGETVKLKIKGAKDKVKWSSNKKNVASVNKKGVVKAKKKGSAKITAKAGKKKYNCKVTVITPYLGDLSKTMYVGDKTHMELHGAKKNQVLDWNSLNESVVKVSADGMLEAVGAGETYIEADLYDVDIILKCKVTVLENQPSQQPVTETPSTPVTDTPAPNAVAVNYTALANYIKANGKIDSSGNYYKPIYMNGESYDSYFDITYSPSTSDIKYIMMMDMDSSEVFLSFTVNIQNPSEGKLYFAFTPAGSTDDYFGIKNMALSSITTNNIISGFDSYNFSNVSILESYNKLAGNALNLGMISWKSIVEGSGLGLTMGSLGFTSY